MRVRYFLLWIVVAIVLPLHADVLTLANGDVISNCYVRDWGTRIDVWDSLDAVGKPPRQLPRSAIKEYKIERGADWDEQPALPDLSVTFIELNPKLPSLHGNVQYDMYGRPKIEGAPVFSNLGENVYMQPEDVVAGVKFTYTPGQLITATAHVRNLGFVPSAGFDYAWYLDDKHVGGGTWTQPLEPFAEATFPLSFPWEDGFHTLRFVVTTDQREIATINNDVTDPLWAMAFSYVVNNGRVKACHQFRTAYGTFSFEDYYRWHIDIMNRLFADSIYPSAPSGILARVRLDRIIYTDDVEASVRTLFAADGLRYDQGGWVWSDSEEELRTGVWKPGDHHSRNQTEWSLPHELGHQLGLTDWYALDDPGNDTHVTPDNGEKIAHMMAHPITMMHWHGPQPFSEPDAGYLNYSLHKPRGYFGDLYFAIPRENTLRIVDANGRGLPGLNVEVFQRSAITDSYAAPVTQDGVTWRPVLEDGGFGRPIEATPIISGTTDAQGLLRLPNRPVKPVRTFNGFERAPNPFGNINVVGGRGLFLVRVTRDEHTLPAYFVLTIYNFNVAWFRGQRDRLELTLRTPFGGLDAPFAPRNLAVAKTDDKHVRVSWQAPARVHEQNYLERVIGYRVYRRISNDGLNIAPWFPVATLNPDVLSFDAALDECPRDIYYFSKTERYGVSSIGENGIESDIVSVVLK